MFSFSFYSILSCKIKKVVGKTFKRGSPSPSDFPWSQDRVEQFQSVCTQYTLTPALSGTAVTGEKTETRQKWCYSGGTNNFKEFKVWFSVCLFFLCVKILIKHWSLIPFMLSLSLSWGLVVLFFVKKPVTVFYLVT